MRLTVLVLAAIGVSGCADQAFERQAVLRQCESVGITANDPEFAVCTKAMIQQHREDAIMRVYHNMAPLTPLDPVQKHQDVQIY
jgi:hypothetical protein